MSWQTQLVRLEFQALLSTSSALTRERHPRMLETFETLCKRNHITSVPRVLVNRFLPAGTALAEENTIIMGEGIFDRFSSAAQEGLAAHEMGHILGNHTLDRYLPNRSALEREAEELSVVIAGSREPALAVLREGGASRHAELMNSQEGNWLQRTTRHAVHKQLDSLITKVYGTRAERMAAVSAVNPADRTHLDGLIREHNARWAR